MMHGNSNTKFTLIYFSQTNINYTNKIKRFKTIFLFHSD